MVSYRTGPVLRHTVARALAQKGLSELILVDNGNPPETLLMWQELAAKNPKLIVISGHGNVGFARGCNLGAARARGEFLLLLNPDCLLPPNALTLFREALESFPGAMLAGPLLLNPDGTEQRAGRRALLTPEAALGEMLRLPGMPRLNLHHLPAPETTQAVPALSGACLFLRRSDYEALGSMDEGYFLHVEDLDFCLRVHRAGGKIICAPQARVVHWRSTSDVSSRFIERCKRDGFLRYFRLHFPEKMSWLLIAGIHARYLAKAFLPRRRRPDACGRQLLCFLEAAAEQPIAALNGLRVLVTGATSQIGPFLLGRLVAAGAKPLALSRNKRHFMADGVEWITGDIHSALPPCDAVIHCAPLWLLSQAIASFAGVKRIVAFGSTSMLAKEGSGSIKERQLALSLKKAEEESAAECARHNIALTILRPTLIYGSGTDRNVSRLARAIKRWRVIPIYPPASGLRRPVHADDLAVAAVQALGSEAAKGRAYNVSGGETLAFRAMAERIAEALGTRALFLNLPFLPAALDAAGRILHNGRIHGAAFRRMNQDLAFPHDDAARDFGYRPRRFLAGGLKDLGR